MKKLGNSNNFFSVLGGVLLLCGSAIAEEMPIRFVCGDTMPVLIAIDAQRDARVSLLDREGQPGCLLHLEEIEGDPDDHRPGHRVQFDLMRKRCDSPEMSDLISREVFVHFFDFWKKGALPISLYQRGGRPVQCSEAVVDWALVREIKGKQADASAQSAAR